MIMKRTLMLIHIRLGVYSVETGGIDAVLHLNRDYLVGARRALPLHPIILLIGINPPAEIELLIFNPDGNHNTRVHS